MPTMTLALDEETQRLIKAHPGINWSQVAREALQRRARELHMWDQILANSKLTDEDAINVGDDIKRSIVRRLGW